jgi:hypothetical protein
MSHGFSFQGNLSFSREDDKIYHGGAVGNMIKSAGDLHFPAGFIFFFYA